MFNFLYQIGVDMYNTNNKTDEFRINPLNLIMTRVIYLIKWVIFVSTRHDKNMTHLLII